MSRTISVQCTNTQHCGYVNIFQEDELMGSVPLVAEDGERVAPPPVEIDENTFVKCEKCGYPISCVKAKISEN